MNNAVTDSIGGVEESTFSGNAAKRAGRRQLTNSLATRVVYAGGWLILASVLAILLVIVFEVLPLFQSPTVVFRESSILELQEGEQPLFGEIDEYLQAGYVVTDQGRWISLGFEGNPKGQEFASAALPGESGARITAFDEGRSGGVFGTSDGAFIHLNSTYKTLYEGERAVVPEMSATEPVQIYAPSGEVPSLPAEPRLIAAAKTAKEELVVTDFNEGVLYLSFARIKRSLMGGETRKESQATIVLPAQSQISALLLSRDGQRLYVGTESGEMLYYNRAPGTNEFSLDTKENVSDTAISSLGFLLGDQSVIIGDATGKVSSWQLLRNSKTGAIALHKIHSFEQHGSPVVHFANSWRNKGFLTASKDGEVRLHYGTTGITQLVFKPNFIGGGEEINSVRMTPKGDGILMLGSKGALELWNLDNPHPEVSWRTLFGKVNYEGYEDAEFVWQSTGATDDFEPKLSAIPLLVGTLKGTLYALIFAVPLAICGAFYASQFMHPALRSYIKPVIELMAALPSVVIGFIAGLWLAPLIEPHLPAVIIFPVVAVVVIAIFCVSLGVIRKSVGLRSFAGVECLLLAPLLLFAAWLSFEVTGWFEASFWAGDYREWLYGRFGVTVDQRNSIVAGIAVGFAVVPVIFTLAEDTLSSVPKHLVAGSLALGATLWQTAYRVVLPVAIPGIFSAVMIGLGRAVGETMIVLMATGNTPVLDWSVFNGFRALSANIAVELPEAPHGGTLYRVLFLTALLLFAMTFVLNTVSEVVRSHFRKKFKYL